jgi:hypothetical protein
MRCSRIKQDNSSSGVDCKRTENNIKCFLGFIHCHMVDPAVNEVLLGCHGSGVTILVRDCIGVWHLVGAGARLGTSTSEVSSFSLVVTPPISGVLYWPLDGLLSLHNMASWSSGLSDIAPLYQLALWSLVPLHGSLGSLLKLSSGLLLRNTVDRSGRWHTYPGPGVIATLPLVLLLPLTIHDTTVVL